MKNKSSSKKQETKIEPVQATTGVPQVQEVEFINAFYLKGAKLESLTTDKETAGRILGGEQRKEAKERKFKTSEDLASFVLNGSNCKELFGDNTLLFDCAEKDSIIFSGGFIPHGILFDLRDKEKLKLYFIEMMLSKENLIELVSRMTSIFHFFRNLENTRAFEAILDTAISKNIGWRNKLKPYLEEKLQIELLRTMLTHKPGILLMTDSLRPELTLFMETYSDTWGKSVKPMAFRKFEMGDDTLLTIVPTFAELTSKRNVTEKKVKETEADHLEGVQSQVEEVYRYLHAELLKTDPALEFRIKGHYISLRKERNIAFFQFGRKRLSIVIANPEKGMRESLKHHSVRTLADSVKKFWNGNEHCFTVDIENREHIEEIVSMLKKLVGAKVNGKEVVEKVEGNSGKEIKSPPVAKEPPKSQTKPKPGKSGKKSQRKKK